MVSTREVEVPPQGDSFLRVNQGGTMYLVFGLTQRDVPAGSRGFLLGDWDNPFGQVHAFDYTNAGAAAERPLQASFSAITNELLIDDARLYDSLGREPVAIDLQTGEMRLRNIGVSPPGIPPVEPAGPVWDAALTGYGVSYGETWATDAGRGAFDEYHRRRQLGLVNPGPLDTVAPWDRPSPTTLMRPDLTLDEVEEVAVQPGKGGWFKRASELNPVGVTPTVDPAFRPADNTPARRLGITDLLDMVTKPAEPATTLETGARSLPSLPTTTPGESTMPALFGGSPVFASSFNTSSFNPAPLIGAAGAAGCNSITIPALKAACLAAAGWIGTQGGGGDQRGTYTQPGTQVVPQVPQAPPQPGWSGAVARILPGGRSGYLGGVAQPEVRNVRTLRCPARYVLGLDELCYPKGSIPRNLRKHIPERRPLLSANDGKILARSKAIGKKLRRVAGKHLPKKTSCAPKRRRK